MIKVFDYNNRSFSKDNIPKHKIIDTNWSRSGDKNASKMHSIASYLAMFSPAMPKYFIDKYTEEQDLIFDPFCGRGTTALKSREMNRRFVGSDLNPYSIVLSRAKISKSSINRIYKKLDSIEKKFNIWLKQDKNNYSYRLSQYKELRYFYSYTVLNQLVFLRNCYGNKWKSFSNTKNILFGIILGLMHGPSRKDGSTIYFSLSMPSTISMAPNYVRKYAKENKLQKPISNIFVLIKNRLKKKYDDILNQDYLSKIYIKNALHKNNNVADKSVKLLMTSPPYLNMVNYTRSNWLKLWLLGYDRHKLSSIKLSDKLNFDSYIDFILEFLNISYPKIVKDGYLAIVVGDVHKKRLIEEVWETIQHRTKFKLEKFFWDCSYVQNKKVTNMLNGKKGKATIVEKVMLLKK